MSYATVYLYGGEAKGLHSGERLLYAHDTGKGLYLSLYNPWTLRRYRIHRAKWEKLVNDSLERYGYEKVFRRPGREAIERSIRATKREAPIGVFEGLLREAHVFADPENSGRPRILGKEIQRPRRIQKRRSPRVQEPTKIHTKVRKPRRK